ncbi:MAG: hypothetical protein RL186_51 [Pseudomonadota bacterium]|jgi:superoxide dismutase
MQGKRKSIVFKALLLGSLSALTLLAVNTQAQTQVQTQATEQTTEAATAPTPPAPAPIKAAPVPPKFDMAEAASRYVTLVKEAERIGSLPALSTDAIEGSLRLSARVSHRGITEGVGAFAALTAASHSEFASGLTTVTNLLGREAVLTRLKEDPDQLFAAISGSVSARKLAAGAIESSLASLEKASKSLGAAAYGVQGQAWAKRAVDTPATLVYLRSEAAGAARPDELSNWVLPPRISDQPISNRYLIAASYKILGEDGLATELLDQPKGRMCMNRVQLNVRQCVAASQYPYEHLFCLSKHSFGEALDCVRAVAD